MTFPNLKLMGSQRALLSQPSLPGQCSFNWSRHMPGRVRKVGIAFGMLLLYATLRPAISQTTHEENVIRRVDKAELAREASLSGYSVTEHYAVRNSRFHADAEMTVAAIYRRVTGKSYSVLSRRGSSLLQTRLLERVLIEEAEMSHGVTRQRALITSANYKMRLIGQESLSGRACEVLELLPRLKSAHLLKGRAWVDAEDYSLVRIEGKTSASPSFLAGRPTISREYEKIQGFSLARRSHAVSDSILFGKTDLTIEYSDYNLTSDPSK